MCKKFKNSVDKHRKGWYTHIRCQVNGFDLRLALKASEKKVKKIKKVVDKQKKMWYLIEVVAKKTAR